ncbi:DinB family protein [Priestia megaterium]|uniref:DinB family protein n=1 Tax=Priestia megaterium TaxID=1404 RepID=UPI001C8DB3A8|nr:DinB family protein [Priestia megaterium]MBY0200862.1 DinB family protein [Priestia megaterium]
MTQMNTAFRDALIKSLRGDRGHLPTINAITDINMELASHKQEELPYSIYQLVKHMSYWQDFLLALAKGENPERPKSVSESWPEHPAPVDEEEWKKTIQHFCNGIDEACQLADTLAIEEPLDAWPSETPGGLLRNIASHNSYHLGEIVIMRRLNRAWPPPTGGFPA